MSKKDTRSRLSEMRAVLAKYDIIRGVTPEKLRMILEDLGPTYIKLGQIMSLHSDILPKEYCDELMRLNSEVRPMPFWDVEEEIRESYGTGWEAYFSEIEKTPLGSASIAQVHRARLKTGEDVIIKVQRRGIYDTMSRDIGLLHRAVKLMPVLPRLRNLVNLDMVLDEMWQVAQEEMDFLKEASNMEEFARCNKDIKYVSVPKLYREYTTSHVLVMEYIDGCAINDRKTLLEEGYDLNEVGGKLVNNYIKQVMEDGYFHADPHPGNVKVRDGKIVWMDMGMMGRLSERDRSIMTTAVQGIAMKDITEVERAVLDLGDFWGKPDRDKLYQDLQEFMERYGNASMGNLDLAEAMQSILEVMKENKIGMPHGMTMLARGLTHMEGVLSEISPDINMMAIASSRVRESYLSHLDPQKELRHGVRHLFRSAYHLSELPQLTSNIMKEYLQGHSKAKIDIHIDRDSSHLLRRLVRNIVMGLWVAGLLIGSSILCTTDMQPKVLGIPALGALGYLLAFVICLYIFIRHIVTRNK